MTIREQNTDATSDSIYKHLEFSRQSLDGHNYSELAKNNELKKLSFIFYFNADLTFFVFNLLNFTCNWWLQAYLLFSSEGCVPLADVRNDIRYVMCSQLNLHLHKAPLGCYIIVLSYINTLIIIFLRTFTWWMIV